MVPRQLRGVQLLSRSGQCFIKRCFYPGEKNLKRFSSFAKILGVKKSKGIILKMPENERAYASENEET
jgi:hypothetical protein